MNEEISSFSGEHKSFKDSAKAFFIAIRQQIRTLTSLKDDLDVESTRFSVEKSIEFKGANVWILAFAIILASVGLDTNSTAVIIGAMLISPLMGPINGIGLSIGIMDSELLKKAVKNFIIMMIISLIASTFYFLISPLGDAQSELLARTRPTIFDVIIAFAGGWAGIVAISRKEQPFAIISGVAIATALMPPLCTAGFGLASGQFRFFLGAFYLFFLNSVFIALATFLFSKLLHFPHISYIDAKKRRKVAQHITLFTILTLVPSIFMAVNVVRETAFNNNVIHFIQDIQTYSVMDSVQIINVQKKYHRNEKSITISLVGKPLSKDAKAILNEQLATHGLSDAKLNLKETHFSEQANGENHFVLSEWMDEKDRQLTLKEDKIQELETQIHNLQNNPEKYTKIAKEILVQYPEIEEVSIADMSFCMQAHLKTNMLPTVYIKWKTEISQDRKTQFANWLKMRLEVEKLRMIEEKQ
jgi:uncharacterized hydrophobic protein (TIGR00271 family)